ncbi:MAG: DUF2851 family protein [Verrucomicrobiota bacterium]
MKRSQSLIGNALIAFESPIRKPSILEDAHATEWRGYRMPSDRSHPAFLLCLAADLGDDRARIPMKLAKKYEAWLEGDSVCETPPLPVGSPISELELQARWFAGEFGREFVTTAGDRVEMVHFGSWNPEPGPHFTGALVSFLGGPAVAGKIEVGRLATDWEAHASGQEFEQVVLHVFAAGGESRTVTPGGRNVPQIRLDTSRFEFPASSNVSRREPGDCSAQLAALSKSQLSDLLEAAAQFRLCRKAQRLAQLSDQSAPAEGLYQALAETLGYRYNKLPFTVLAQRFPLSQLRKEPDQIETLLFAGSGFLTATDLGALDGDTRGYLRDLWSQWWPRRTEFETLILSPKLWKLAGIRPVNHPQRRIAALAAVVRNWAVIQTLALQCDVGAIRNFFSQLQHEYWDFHYTLTSKRSKARMALVGEGRVTEMLANVFFPAAIKAAPRFWHAYRELPAHDLNQRVEQAAARLLHANPAAPELLKLTLFQQGLMQLQEDYCIGCDHDCSRCLLPKKLEQWES